MEVDCQVTEVLFSKGKTNVQVLNSNLRTTRYHTPLEFPLLSTFPPILSVVPVSDPRMPLHTSLSTSSSIADWTRSIGREVKGSLGGLLGREEKEALVNSLGEIAETYIEDWESAGDSDDD